MLNFLCFASSSTFPPRDFSFLAGFDDDVFLILFISVFMGPTEVPSQSAETIKIPTAHYEFGANYIDPKVCSLYNFHRINSVLWT